MSGVLTIRLTRPFLAIVIFVIGVVLYSFGLGSLVSTTNTADCQARVDSAIDSLHKELNTECQVRVNSAWSRGYLLGWRDGSADSLGSAWGIDKTFWPDKFGEFGDTADPEVGDE